MSIVLDLSPDLHRRLADRAAQDGVSILRYIENLVRKDLDSRTAVDEALAPFRKQVEEGGITEEELDALVEEVRDEIWREKQTRADAPR